MSPKATKDSNKSPKNYTDITVAALPDREIEIIGTITAEKMSVVRAEAIKKFREAVEIPGFRKGNAPENLVVQKVGEMALMEEAAEIALNEEYPNILEEKNIDAIGRPAITITKIGVGSPLEFKIKTALMPDIKLADYKKLAQKENSAEEKPVEVSDTEINDVIENIRKNIAHQKMHTDHGLGEDAHEHPPITEKDLPEITDEFVKTLGTFADVADFKAKVKENIAAEKKLKEKDKKRTTLIETIMDKSTIDMPKIIVEGELDKMVAQFKDDIARAGVPYDQYLAHIKKTEADLRTEWNDTAVKRAKSQIILNTIAKDESIAPSEEDVKKEMEHILAHYPDSDRFRVRMYVETFMTNELVFKFLEEQK